MFSDNSIRRVFYGRNVKYSKQTAATTHHMQTNGKTRCMRKITSFEQCQPFYFSLFAHLVGCLYVNRAKTNKQKKYREISFGSSKKYMNP